MLLKTFEQYNNNKLNELIIKYFNKNSEAIIEIIDSYESVSDVVNIFEKISFLIESVGDVEAIENGGELTAYYIDLGDENKPTFVFDINTKKFKIKPFNKI